MFTATPTKHATQRMAQRAILMSDVELITVFGTECADGYIFRERDSNELARELKHILQRLENLRGMRIVTDGDNLITTYHATDRMIKELKSRRQRNRRFLQ